MGWFESLFAPFIKRHPEWDGAERRQAFRVKCDFEVEIQAPGCSYLAACLDAGPQGLRMRVRGPFVKKVLRRAQPIRLRYVEPLYEAELDTVSAAIRWVRRDGEQMFTMAVGFDDTIDNLKRSWVKPILQKVFKSGSRKNQRNHMRARCQLAGKAVIDGQRVDIKVTDVSTSGARLSALQPMAIGSIFEVEFEKVIQRAVVRRCQPDYGVYRIGVAFSPDAAARAKLLTLVKRLVEMSKMMNA
jgi:hypothetical protein